MQSDDPAKSRDFAGSFFHPRRKWSVAPGELASSLFPWISALCGGQKRTAKTFIKLNEKFNLARAFNRLRAVFVAAEL
jgi:hypothetical protein